MTAPAPDLIVWSLDNIIRAYDRRGNFLHPIQWQSHTEASLQAAFPDAQVLVMQAEPAQWEECARLNKLDDERARALGPYGVQVAP